MTTQHIYATNKETKSCFFWSDGVNKRGAYTQRKDGLIRDKSFREKYAYFSDYKDNCVLLIPKEFC